MIDMRNVGITICKKVLLRNVESLIDRSEPRNLILGFVHSSKGSGGAPSIPKPNFTNQKKKSILAFGK